MSEYDYLTNQLKIAEHEWQTYYKVSENMARMLCERDVQIRYLSSIVSELIADKADKLFDHDATPICRIANEQWGNQ